MIINNDQALLIADAEAQHANFDPKRDGHKLNPGTFAFVQGEPVTITADNGVWLDWVPGHVELHTGNARCFFTLTENA